MISLSLLLSRGYKELCNFEFPTFYTGIWNNINDHYYVQNHFSLNLYASHIRVLCRVLVIVFTLLVYKVPEAEIVRHYLY